MMTDAGTVLRNLLIPLLIAHEGSEQFPYDDKTGHRIFKGDQIVGKITIGVGRNLSDEGITQEEQMFLLRNDITSHLNQCQYYLEFFASLDQVRQAAIVDMVFNLGIAGFMKFHQAIAYLTDGNWVGAGRHIRGSLWFKQVGKRGDTIARMIENGQFPTLDDSGLIGK